MLQKAAAEDKIGISPPRGGRESVISPMEVTGMVKLTQEEQEIMTWAAESFKTPWLDLCEVFQKMNKGEKLTREEGLIDPYFLPFDIDARILYRALKAGGKKAILGDNGSMLTIIMNTRGDKIIWSAVELEEDGAYTEFFPLKDQLGKAWDKKGAEMIFDNDMEGAFAHFADWIKTQKGMEHIDLGILKVANIQFFGCFKRAWEESDNGSKIGLMGIKMVDAVREIMDEGWVKFQPAINLKKLLELMAPALNTLDPLNAALQQALSKLPF
jgi:hypothetical protein